MTKERNEKSYLHKQLEVAESKVKELEGVVTALHLQLQHYQEQHQHQQQKEEEKKERKENHDEAGLFVSKTIFGSFEEYRFYRTTYSDIIIKVN